jgi:hypothetical protein
MLKPTAFRRKVYVYDRAPVVVNSAKNDTTAGVPLFLDHKRPDLSLAFGWTAQPWE